MLRNVRTRHPEKSFMTIPLRHGVFVVPFHAMNENPTQCIRRDMHLCELLDDLGFDEAWVGEHHSAGMEIIASPEVFIAGAAERTRRIRFGTGVISLPYHNPLMTANRIIQLDHQTMGRCAFGFGPGLLASDAIMLGIDIAEQRDRFAQGLDVLVRLLNGEWVTEKTDWYNFIDAHVHIPPYSLPLPELAVASAMTPSGGRLAGKYDLSMLCVAANITAGYDALAVNWKTANDVAAEQGRSMDPRRLRLVMPMHLADTKKKAMENMRFGLQEWIDYYNNNMPRLIVPKGVDPVQWYIDNKVGVIGTVDDAIEAIDRLYAKQGDFGMLLMLAKNCADWEATKHSYELYARYVMPHYAKASASRLASYKWVTDNQPDFSDRRQKAQDSMIARHMADQERKAKQKQPE
jgi:limonene 1,2-monooxygenase